jgi:transposase-like protein
MDLSEEDRPLTIVETASTTRSHGSRRRRLSQDEAREIARLYGETSTPTSEIRERFGIGDSSLYRVVQRQGVALRGRTAGAAPGPRPARASANGRRRASSASPRTDSKSSPVRRASVKRRTPASASPRAGDRQQFRVSFVGERVIQAADVRDALRQAAALGATEITSVARAD